MSRWIPMAIDNRKLGLPTVTRDQLQLINPLMETNLA
jgi:hypothetical protein